MPARAISAEDLPSPLPCVIAFVGDEEYLVDRGISAVATAARAADPAVIETQLVGSQLEGGELREVLSPSLFGDAKLVVIRAAQDIRVAAAPAVLAYLEAPVEATVMVLHHAGAGKGKGILDAARKAKALEIGCARLTRAEDRADFVRSEVRAAGGRISPDAVGALLDAVGSDLRELAGVCAQLVSDSGGDIGADIVRAYHRGRAEVSGFNVADLAVVGRSGPALEALRSALAVGVPQVVIADALADGVRSIARVASAGKVSENELAKRFAMPPWKVRRAASQGRGWTEAGLRRALGVVARLNADVKGEAVDPDYALERAIRQLSAARGQR